MIESEGMQMHLVNMVNMDLRYSATVVCMVATVAAIQEWYLVNRNVMN